MVFQCGSTKKSASVLSYHKEEKTQTTCIGNNWLPSNDQSSIFCSNVHVLRHRNDTNVELSSLIPNIYFSSINVVMTCGSDQATSCLGIIQTAEYLKDDLQIKPKMQKPNFPIYR